MASRRLWTKLSAETARAHSSEALALGIRGYGHVGDPVCSFEPADSVVFVPPAVESVAAG